MKIIYCLPQLYMPGGIERICTIKANYLSSIKNWEVLIVTAEQKDKPPFYALSDKVRVIDAGIPYSKMQSMPLLKRILTKIKLQKEHKRSLTAILLKEKADIVISTLSHEASFITSIRDSSKKILEFHFCRGHKYRMAKAFGFRGFTKLAYYLQCLIEEKIIIPKFDQFIVLTKEDQHNWSSSIKNVKHISNILPFESSQLASLDAQNVIAVGRYDSQKRFDHLIKIWGQITKKYPEWHLNIYGQGKDKSKLLDLISELECDTISLHAPSKDIKRHYMESSIFVMTSSYEGLPMTLLEATGMGLPAVCYSFPCGPKDIIEDGINGYIIEDGNMDLFAERLAMLIENTTKRKEMGQNAYIRSKQYSKDVIMEQWIKLFENIINN